ncbi:BEN domain-containing protein 2 [Erinaceus europaeus]|uniref:BEN domain-containing protein 2 n=1 Tax=Erinaceus europaeus TaxID=9365 RepID=A0ABM3WQ22_ERIEU|nr:BEN domain-containing protein 2 [Erinaceus europaeus]
MAAQNLEMAPQFYRVLGTRSDHGTLDYFIITVEEGSNDSSDIMIIEEPQVEILEDGHSTDDILIIDSEHQGSSNNYQEISETSNGIENISISSDDCFEISSQASLKICDPSTAQVEFIEEQKVEQSCVPEENNVGDCSLGLPVNRQEHYYWVSDEETPLVSPVVPQVQQLVITGSPPHPSILSTGIPVKIETSVESITESTLVENESRQVLILPAVAVEKYILIGIPKVAETSVINIETVNAQISLENNGGQSSSFSSICLPSHVVIEMPGKAEVRLDDSSQRVHRPDLVGSIADPEMNAAPVCLPPNFVYLGDPKRNVKVLGSHLETARKKTRPEHAACYLVRNMFSKEILIRSSVGNNSEGLQPLDPNKVAAIREFLEDNFSSFDLSERGIGWQMCISSINSLIHFVCYEARRKSQKAIAGLKSHTKPKSETLKNKSDGDGKRSSHSSQQATVSKPRESENSQQNSLAVSEEVKSLASMNSVIPFEMLDYFGKAWRNIQLPCSVLKKAREKPRPELSARYLIRQLFTVEVLIKSNVYGNQRLGIYALNASKIHALREFLQDAFPQYDLSDSGYKWKLCVAAINSSIRSLRYDLKKAKAKSQREQPQEIPESEDDTD